MDAVAEMFRFQAGFAEMFIRGTTIYWVMFLLLRLAGRRDVGSLGTADLLVLLLVADAAGTAMSGGSDSLGDGMVVIGTIVGWSSVVDRLVFYFPWLRKVVEPGRVCLVRNGRINIAGMRSEHITRQELMEQLRLKGVASLAVVKRAYIESSGEFSVICASATQSQAASTLEE